mgnify:FL=1
MNGRNKQYSLPWCVFLLALPLPALPFYWMLGRSRLGGYIERRESLNEETDDLLQEVGRELEPYRCSRPAFSYAESLTSLVPTVKNKVELYDHGEAAFEAIIDAVGEAREYILAQFYVIRDDQAGQTFLRRLKEAARGGVRVYLYVDPLESQVSDEDTQDLQDSGVRMAWHSPGQSGSDPIQGNFRNHRKLVVVDGKLALLGGMNVGDNYLSRESQTSPWNDLFLRLQGPAVLNAQLGFFRDYYFFTGDRPELNWQAAKIEDGEAAVAVFPTDPGNIWDSCGLAYVEAIGQAKSRILLASPYFLPDEKALAALQNALLRGVEVVVLRPHKTLVRTADLAAWHYVEQLLPHGVKFFRQPEGVMHKKVMLVDDDLSLIGSANFDYRSFHLNHELFLWIDCQTVNQRLEKILTEEMERFQPLSEEDLSGRNLSERLLTEAASLLVPLL